MEFSQTQPYSNITIKEEPLDEEYFTIQEVYNDDPNLFEIKEEPEETFTIEEYFEIPSEVKEEKLDEEISEIIKEQLKSVAFVEKNVINNPAKKIKLNVKEEPKAIKEEPEDVEEQFEIIIPKLNEILSEHNYFMWDKFNEQNYIENPPSKIEQDEDGIEYEEVNLFETEIVKVESKIHPKYYALEATTSKKNLRCPECPTVLEDTLRLNRHMRLHRAPQFQCKNCLKWFKRQSTLQNHVCDLKCPICPDTCTCDIDTSSQNCKICLKIDFRYFADYKRHMVEYHNEVVICEICELNKYTLFKHKQQGHSIEKHFKCPQCPLVLKTTELLGEHMKKHSNIFECKFCSRRFTRKFLLVEHERLHENPMAYYCKKCDKSFRGKFCLSNHMKTIHHEIRTEKRQRYEVPYHQVDREGWIRCPHCPLLFRSRDSLNKHSDQAHSLSSKKWSFEKSAKKFETTVSSGKK